MARTHGNDLRAKLPEHGRSDLVGGAVGAIHDNFQPAQAQVVRKTGLAEFNIATLGIFLAQCFADCIRIVDGHGLFQPVLDFTLNRIGQFLAIR